MAGRYGRRLKKEEDFEEGEVWGTVMEERENLIPMKMKKNKNSTSSLSLSPTSSVANNGSSRPRMIPRSSSSTTNESAPQTKQFSAPLDIPDWSKIYGSNPKNKKTNYNFATSWVHHHHNHHHYGYYGHHDDDDDEDGHDDDDDDGEDGVVPPHEYLARKLARSQISSFSVYEGIGRTLKGRDLSKVRNAVLTKTGFLES